MFEFSDMNCSSHWITSATLSVQITCGNTGTASKRKLTPEQAVHLQYQDPLVQLQTDVAGLTWKLKDIMEPHILKTTFSVLTAELKDLIKGKDTR